MKAYLVVLGEYSDFKIDSVWLDKAECEAYVQRDIDPETGYSVRGKYAYELEIQEWTVGAPLDSDR